MAFFKKPTAIGARLSERGVELGEIRFQGDRASFVRVAEAAFASGAYERGEIKDADEVAEAIRRARQGGIFSGTAVHAVLPDIATYVHVFSFPGFVSDQELMTAVAFQAEEVLPVDLSELVWRAHVIKRGGQGTTVRFSGVPNHIVFAHAQAFATAGLSLKGLGLESEAIDRVGRFSHDLKEGARLVVDLSDSVASAFLYSSGGVRASFSQISLRPESLFGSDAPAQAAAKKGATPRRAKKAPPRLPHVRADRLNDLAFHTDAILDWFEDAEPETKIAGVFLLATEAQAEIAEGLKSRLAGERPNLPVEVPDMFANVENNPLSKRLRDEGRDLAFAHVLGAAAMGARPLNGEADFVSEPRHSPFAFVNGLAAAPAGLFRRPPARDQNNAAEAPAARTSGKFPAAVLVLLAFLLAGAGFWIWKSRSPFVSPASPTSAFAPFVRDYTVDVEGESADIPGKRFSAAAIARERSAAPSKVSEKEGKAHGNVTLVNETDRAYDLVATTRLLSDSGRLFRLRDLTHVPAGSSAVAVAVADAPGSAGDIGPSRFTLPGLPASVQTQVYATSDTPMSGGAGSPVGLLTEEEIALAVEDMRRELETDVAEAFAGAEFAEDYAFLPPWTRVTSVSVETDPPAGTEAAAFTVRASFDAEALGIDRLEAEDAARAAVAEQLGIDPLDVDPDTLEVGLRAKDISADWRAGTVTLLVAPVEAAR